MTEIEEVIIDALMYLKYIVYEIKEKQRKNILMYFISPKDKKLKNFINSSGFVTYNSRKNKYLEKAKQKSSFINNKFNIESNKKNFKIKRSNNIDVEINKNIVDFAFNGKNRILYNMMSELMENTVLHAYSDKRFLNHKDWYVFSEKDDEKISFVFLDTGLGISRTIKKRVEDYVKFWKDESELLLSALKGDKRTRTKKLNRGKGLPFLFNLNKDGKIQNLRVISNKACYNLNGSKDISEELNGTFFYWEMIRKDVNKNENL